MHCTFHQSQICHSCSLLHLEYQQTLKSKLDTLTELFPETAVREFRGMTSTTGSRIRARLAITGSLEKLEVGFFDDQQRIIPVDQCPLHHPLINAWAATLPTLIRDAKLTPYDMHTDRGELKFVVITCSPTHQQLMIQFVLRSREAVDRIRSLWRRMSEHEKETVKVVSINLQPARSSAISGRDELPVSEQTCLPIRFGQRELLFGPQSFLQTNYEIADSLYETVGEIVRDNGANGILDLYCGVGAFSLTATSGAQPVLGIDVSTNAIACANEAAGRNGIANAVYECRSLECTTVDQLADRGFDTIICNPPRRGMDAASVSLIQSLRPSLLLYSSCNASTLKRDTTILAGDYRIESLQPFDMFPYTPHMEVLAVMRRK